jgi:hypothetical protein
MTRIELVSSGVVDMYDDVALSLNFSIADIQEPDKRTASYSKTILLPGTKNNNDRFKHIYNIDSYCNFNPNNKARIVVYQNDVFILEGYLRLNNIIDNDGIIEYDVVVYSDNANLFFDISDRELTDLDFSDLNHVYTQSTIEASWIAPVGVGYVYPAIMYGNVPPSKTEDYKPAIYVKEYIDRIFRQAGYQYTSPFFSSDYFKRLIIPFTGGTPKLTEEDMSQRYVRVVKYAATSYPKAPNSFTYTDVDWDLVANDFLSQANATTNIITVARAGQYKFRFSCNFSTTGYIVDNITIWQQSFDVNAGLSPAPNFWVLSNPSQGINNNGVVFESTVHTLKAGDTIKLSVRLQATEVPVITKSFTLSNVDWSMISANANIVASADMPMNIIVPRKVKQKDFFMSIVKMFNLYIDYDKRNSRKVIIEPRDDFYSSGVVVDWNDKIDRSQPIEIMPTVEQLSKTYTYAYKSDRDYYNNGYQNKYSETYGQKRYEVGGDLVKGEKKIDVIFSNTPIVNSGGRLLSSIQSADGKPATTEFNIRILYYNPVYIPVNSVLLLYYAYAGHLDNPYNPYRDLSFGVPREINFNTTVYTNQTLFNLFHRNGLNEITSQHSRVVKAKAILNEADIGSLDFRNIFYFDGHFLRLLSIEDYDTNNIGACTVKFLKIRRKDIPHSSNFNVVQQENYGGLYNDFTEVAQD